MMDTLKSPYQHQRKYPDQTRKIPVTLTPTPIIDISWFPSPPRLFWNIIKSIKAEKVENHKTSMVECYVFAEEFHVFAEECHVFAVECHVFAVECHECRDLILMPWC